MVLLSSITITRTPESFFVSATPSSLIPETGLAAGRARTHPSSVRRRAAEAHLAPSLFFDGGDFVLTGPSLSLLPHQNKLQAQSLEAFSN
jgi:hypothetical protein